MGFVFSREFGSNEGGGVGLEEIILFCSKVIIIKFLVREVFFFLIRLVEIYGKYEFRVWCIVSVVNMFFLLFY